MYMLAFKVHGKPDMATEIRQSLKGITEKVKKLEGCIDALVYSEISDENIFFLTQECQKRQALEDHLNSSLFAALLGISSLLEKPPEIRRYIDD